MPERIFYNGRNMFLRGFLYFEPTFADQFAGVQPDGQRVFIGADLSRVVREHQVPDPEPKKRTIDRLKEILGNQADMGLNYPPLDPQIEQQGNRRLHLYLDEQEVIFVFDPTGEKLLGLVNYKE